MLLHCEQGKGVASDNYELILAKQRNGPARRVIPLRVTGELNKIEEAWVEAY